MRASIVVVIISLLGLCVADFDFPTFTQSDIDNDFSIIGNAGFDSASNALQLVRSARNQVGAAFHYSEVNGQFEGEYIAPGFITQFTFQTDTIVGNGGAGIALVLQPNGYLNLGTTGAGIGYGDYQNGQQGIYNSLAIEIDLFKDTNMNDPNNNHIGVHSTGNNPNSSNESAVILGLVNATIPVVTNTTSVHSVYIEYQGNITTLAVYLDGVQVLYSTSFNLTEWILLEPGTGESYIGLSSSTNQNDYFDVDVLSWYFWQGNGTVVPDATQIYGPGFVSADYNQINTYYIQLIDNFGYNITIDAATPTCAVAYGTDTANLTNIQCTVTYLSGGLYQADYNQTEVGTFTLITTVETYVNTTILVVTGPPVAANTVASGPGLSSAVAGEISSFTITTYDASNAISTGDASFNITLTLTTDNSVVVQGQASSSDGTGTYSASYNVTVAGVYSLSVVLVGQTDIQGSPFTVTAIAGAYSAANSYAFGPGIFNGVAGEVNYFFVQAVDAFGNNATSPTSWNITSGNGNALTSESSTQIGSAGLTNNTYIQTVAGVFPLVVTDQTTGENIQGSPFNVEIFSALASPQTTTASGDTSSATAGVLGVITITPLDQYGNAVNSSNLLFTATITGPSNSSSNATYNTDGTYTVTYNLTTVGSYQVSISLLSGGVSTGEIVGSPFTVGIYAGPVYVPLSYAYGPGLSSAEAGVIANFTIQAVDAYNNTITFGTSAAFVLTFDSSFNGTIYTVVPNGDGTYSASYVGLNTGIFNLTVSSGSEQILGSPFSVNITAGPAYGPISVPSGTALSSAVAGENSTFAIATYDQYGNPITGYGGPCTGYLQDINDLSVNYTLTCFYVSGNTYDASYNVTDAGNYEIFVFINDLPVSSTPANVTVSPGPLYAATSTASGLGLSEAVAGVPALFNITARDQWGNEIPGNPLGVPPFDVVLTKDNNTAFGFVTYYAGGLYLANYTLTAPTGAWSLNVSSGGVSISGSPFTVNLTPGLVSATNSFPFPVPLPDATAYEPYTFWVQAVDVYGNNETSDSGVTFDATITGPTNLTVPSVYYQNGQYAFNFNLTTGNYSVFVSLQGNAVGNGVPLPLTVTAGLPAANYTIVTGFGKNYSRAGEVANFTIITYDLGGVAYTSGGQNFSIVLSQTTGNETITSDVTLTDNNDGTYLGQYNVTLAAVWELSINLTSGPYPGPVKDSPFFPIVYAGPNCPENAQVLGLVDNFPANTTQFFQIQSQDCYGNDVLSSDVYYDVLVQGPDCTFGSSVYWELGIINVTYTVTVAGNYSISIYEKGTPINGNPYAVVATGDNEEVVPPESGLSSTSLIFMWLMIVFIILYVIFCLLLIGFVVFTQRKQLQRNFSNYKKIQSDSSSSSSSD